MKIETQKKELYYEGVGRRKEATARIRLYKGSSDFVVNGADFKTYFKTETMWDTVVAPMEKLKLPEKFGVSAKVSGGGLTSQSEAVRLGISRALLEYSEELRKKLARLGYLRRDARSKERKKYGLKKARRAPQWAKR